MQSTSSDMYSTHKQQITRTQSTDKQRNLQTFDSLAGQKVHYCNFQARVHVWEAQILF